MKNEFYYEISISHGDEYASFRGSSLRQAFDGAQKYVDFEHVYRRSENGSDALFTVALLNDASDSYDEVWTASTGSLDSLRNVAMSMDSPAPRSRGRKTEYYKQPTKGPGWEQPEIDYTDS